MPLEVLFRQSNHFIASWEAQANQVIMFITMQSLNGTDGKRNESELKLAMGVTHAEEGDGEQWSRCGGNV